MTFSLDRFVTEIRDAAGRDRPTAPIRELMKAAVSEPALVASQIPHYEGDQLNLHTDDQVSIYCVKFLAGLLVPPHNHTISAFIAVYQGTEVNRLFRHDGGSLELIAEKHVPAGEILSIGPDGIHAVHSANGEDSLALHVYLGPLERVSRSLFHPDTGEEMPFTPQNYDDLLRTLPSHLMRKGE